MSQLTAEEILVISREFRAEDGRFSGLLRTRAQEPLAVIDVMYRVLHPDAAVDASGVDAAIAMIPREERRENVRAFVQRLLAMPAKDRGHVRGRDRRGHLGSAVVYLATILFGSARPSGEAFANVGGTWRLELLGIQYQKIWDALSHEEMAAAFVKPSGDPAVDEMKWSVVIPSLELLTFDHLNGNDLYDRFGAKFDTGVSIRTVTAFLAKELHAFSRKSEKLPYTIYLGGASIDDIATIYCETEMRFVPSEPVQRMQLVTVDMVSHGVAFPTDLPWGPRPSWLDWELPWPTPHWRPMLPYVPNRFESDTYNEAALAARKFGTSVYFHRIPETTLQGIVDYCRGILEEVVDAETLRTVAPSPRFHLPKQTLYWLFLLNSLRPSTPAERAYTKSRRYLVKEPPLISKSTTIAVKIYEPLHALIVDRALVAKPPSVSTMAWAIVHALDILVIFSARNVERTELAREVTEWKSREGAVVQQRTPLDALVALAKEDEHEYWISAKHLNTSIAMALRDHGYEIGIHELSYVSLVSAGEGIRRELAAAQDATAIGTAYGKYKLQGADAHVEHVGCGAMEPVLIGGSQRMRRKPRAAVMKNKTVYKPHVKVDVRTKGNFDLVTVVNKAMMGGWGMHVLAGLKQIVVISPVALSREAAIGIAREIKDGVDRGDPNFTKAFIESGVLVPSKEIDAINPRHRARADQTDLLLKDIIDSKGNVKSGMPWQPPYRVWPIMNFWRLWRATRQKDRVAGRLHIDRSLRYRGLNALTLERDYNGADDPANRGRMLPFYVTLVQARDLGGTVSARAPRITVTRWIPDRSVPDQAQQASVHAADESGAALRGYARTFHVVNVQDVKGSRFISKVREVLLLMAKEDDRVDVEEGASQADVVAAMQRVPTDPEVLNRRGQSLLNEVLLVAEDEPQLEWGATVIPHYSHSRDRILMPPLESFQKPATMWHTIFHELTHWTNKDGRVPRRFKDEGHFTTKSLTGDGTRTVFQDEEMPPKGKRAVEELIAEIGSYMLMGEAGLDTQPGATAQSEAYIRSWVKLLQQTKRRFWLSLAANTASRAVDYLLRSRQGDIVDLFGENDLDIEAQQAEEAEQGSTSASGSAPGPEDTPPSGMGAQLEAGEAESAPMEEIPRISVRLPWKRREFATFEAHQLSEKPTREEQALNSVGVAVEKKTRKHPWKGKGFPAGYALGNLKGQGAVRQGVHLVLRRRGRYAFDLARVPSLHPFYISIEDKGGPDGSWNWPEAASLRIVTKPAYGRLIKYRVPPAAPSDLWYACAVHEWMGGPVSILARDGLIVAHLEDSNAFAMRDEQSGAFYASDNEELQFDTLDALLAAHNVKPGVAIAKLGTSIGASHEGITVHTLSDADQKDDVSDATPVRLMRNGTPLCWHVSTHAQLMQWLEEDMPVHGELACPKCGRS